ncbi:hypothetical protein [Pikeienuella sp. HZG-20]|uniref:hypothetical protein n=1 Tax=Paludibacillus litoralis TaxID=3133267 RepID=UPI0030ED8376
MPPKIKIMLTAMVVIATIAAWFFRDLIGMTASPALLFGLGAFMCFALWLFPEVKKDARGR